MASITYVATDIFAGVRYSGYSFFDHAVSELFAIGAPTSHIVVPLFTLSSTLVAVFAVGVWRLAGRRIAMRCFAVMLAANATDSLVLWNVFRMHMRGVTPTFIDLMHGILAVNPFVLASTVLGIVVFTGAFRFYSAVTMVLLVVPAVVSFSNLTAFVAHQPTPGMGLAERVSQYAYQLWQAVFAVVLLREGRHIMSRAFGFTTAANAATFWAAYDDALKVWQVPYEELDVPTQFGSTHVILSGPTGAPPLVLLHGYMATSTMWAPNIAAFSNGYRTYAIDVMGQSSKSIPEKPIQDGGDYVTWLTETLDALHLDRVSLVGMSFGGWLAGTYAIAKPQRVEKLVLLSAGGFLPMVRQFSVRGMLMMLFPTRFTVNSFMGWLGITDEQFLRLVYLGLKHFRVPPETARVMPTPFSDSDLQGLRVPTLVLFGDHEVIYDPADAVARARQLMPSVEADLIPGCSHDMCVSHHRLVDARVLDFLKNETVASKPAA